jgi:hypothetical protein
VPPVQALAALHGFWLMLAVAALVLALGRLNPGQLRLLGLASTAMASVGLLVFIGWDFTHWLATVPDSHRYLFQRVLFAIGTNTDIPLIPVAAAGAVCWIVGRLRMKRRRFLLANSL